MEAAGPPFFFGDYMPAITLGLKGNFDPAGRFSWARILSRVFWMSGNQKSDRVAPYFIPSQQEILMTHCVRLSALFAIMLAAFLHAPSAHAQQARTWVASNGDDANPCTRTAPCRTFQGAMSKTQTGGEIDAIDAQGYSGLNVFKSITIDGGNGQGSSMTLSGTN